jgi:ATP-dependent RNA helicase RhlE
MTFAELPLCAALQRAIAEEQYVTPTPIQAAAIPHIVAGRDVLGCAQTGTGKTAAFALPLLQYLDAHRKPAAPTAPRVLVLAPTRELAGQIGDSVRTYGRYLALRHTVIFGGVGQHPQVRALDRGVHLLVATPGRLLDLMQQGHLSLHRVEVLVLDEADRMLDMGFLPDLRRIVAALPRDRQSLFFSATMPPAVAQLAATLLRNPVRVEVTPPSSTVDRIEQRVILLGGSEKRSRLRELLSDNALHQVLVFTRTKRRANDVAKQLLHSGIAADAIHGNKSQNARQRALDRFRSGRLRVLVATDVAARGLDVDGISHVINYDLPTEPESYVHRIGRTGRAGASGMAITFCEQSERNQLRTIERLIGIRLLPDGGTARQVPATTEPAQRAASGDRERGYRPQGKHFRSGGQHRSSHKRRNGKGRPVGNAGGAGQR